MMQKKVGMRIVHTIAEMRQFRRQFWGSLGFVPTMGYLHEGHMTLVRHARRDNDRVVVSIFVNPTQFGPSEDFARYPRDMQRDLAMLEAENVDVVFSPAVEEMYPAGSSTLIDVGPISEPLEGAYRPGHFRGVATVVAKLFQIVAPTKAYFGQKDAQQVRVIQRMARDLNFDVDVVTVPTMREPDGLAMSSRNIYLSPAEHQAAMVLHRSLRLAELRFRDGLRDAHAIKREMTKMISTEPTVKIEYVSLADTDTLRELDELNGPALVSLAAHVGTTRLIDNTMLQ